MSEDARPQVEPTRREGGASDQPQATQREGQGPAPTARESNPGFQGGFPNSLLGRFTIVEVFDARGAESDGYRIRDQSGQEFFLKVYRRGVSPKPELLERIRRADPKEVIRLYEYGQTEEGLWFERLEYAPQGTLGALIRQWPGKAPDDFLQETLQELATALSHIHSLDIEHRDLKPENILVRTLSPLDLVLTDFGIASMLDASIRMTSAHRTDLYAPPEAFAGEVYRTKWDYWSLGMILVEMIAGGHPLAGLGPQAVTGRLVTGSVDSFVDGVSDAAWRKLCRGLLRRDPRKRWAESEVGRWLRNPNDPSLRVDEDADEVPPGASRASPLRFSGRDYATPNDLAAAMGANWADAEAFWRSGDQQRKLSDWLRHELGLGPLARAVEDVDRTQGLKADAQLFLVIRMLGGAPTFRGRPLSAASIEEAGVSSLGGDAGARGWLQQVQSLDLLSLEARAPNADRSLGEIVVRWNRAISEFGTQATAVAKASGNAAPQLAGDTLALLLGAASGEEGLEIARVQAGKAGTRSARSTLWYARIGDARTASPAAATLLVVMAGAAAAEVAAARKQRAARNDALWGHMTIGGLLAVGVAGLFWMAAASMCGRSSALCVQHAWQTRTLSMIDLIYLGLAVGGSIAVLITVQLRTATSE